MLHNLLLLIVFMRKYEVQLYVTGVTRTRRIADTAVDNARLEASQERSSAGE